MFQQLIKDNLVWFPEKGVGFYPVKVAPYDEFYFNKYKEYAATEMGKKITAARIKLVNRYYSGRVIDVGIGCGDFVKNRPNTYGYDVNPAGVEWLKNKNLFVDIYNTAPTPALSFWDSLEHIENIEKAVLKATEWVFVSLPIFKNSDHVLKSKHYRKDEHFWYFTKDGVIRFFKSLGFAMVERSLKESCLGREGIESFAFNRVVTW